MVYDKEENFKTR